MQKKRFSVEQIAGILKQAELGTRIAELRRQHGVSQQSFYRWKKVYGGMPPSEARELKQLREENTKLKRLVADPSLDKVMLLDVVLATPPNYLKDVVIDHSTLTNAVVSPTQPSIDESPIRFGCAIAPTSLCVTRIFDQIWQSPARPGTTIKAATRHNSLELRGM